MVNALRIWVLGTRGKAPCEVGGVKMPLTGCHWECFHRKLATHPNLVFLGDVSPWLREHQKGRRERWGKNCRETTWSTKTTALQDLLSITEHSYHLLGVMLWHLLGIFQHIVDPFEYFYIVKHSMPYFSLYWMFVFLKKRFSVLRSLMHSLHRSSQSGLVLKSYSFSLIRYTGFKPRSCIS